MRLRQSVLLVLGLALFGYQSIEAAPSKNSLMERIRQSYQCPKCNLSKIKFSEFKPGFIRPEKCQAKNQTEHTPDCELNCNFEDTNFSKATLKKIYIAAYPGKEDTLVKTANFTNANFQEANLSDSYFEYVNFQQANFSKIKLLHVTFDFCNMSHANFSHAELVDFDSVMGNTVNIGSNFQDANFEGATFNDSDLTGDFRGANFSHAQTEKVSLTTSEEALGKDNLAPADFWENTNFSYTDLRTIKLTALRHSIDLSKAILCHTIMQDGSINNRDCNKKIEKDKQA